MHRHASGQSLRGGQGDATHALRIELRKNLDRDFPILRVQQRVDRGN